MSIGRVSMSFFTIKKIHFVGIGGHGVSALARLALALGMEVSGSDLEDSPIVQELKTAGAKIWIGHEARRVDKKMEMVVHTSAAIENENEELKEAKKLDIPAYSYFETLGLISKERETIAVSGTNGKTTTTILLGLMLSEGGFDPLVIGGGNVQHQHGGGFRFGNGPFVVEACEAFGNFLRLEPSHLIITNIEEDHLDYYKDLGEIMAAFKKMIEKIKDGGIIVWNKDDKNSRVLFDDADVAILIKTKNLKVKNFALVHSADFFAADAVAGAEGQKFRVVEDNFEIKVPGLFNIYNALAAASTAMILKVEIKAIQNILADFKGSWRRFELLGDYKGAIIISDYGHHPAAVVGTIEAAKQKYPGQRVVTVFHPHHKWRTHFLFNDFIKAFLKSDVVILNEIWSAPGREPAEYDISSLDLVKELKKQGKEESYFGADLVQTKKILDSIIKPGDAVLIMGAGFIYKLAEKITRP